MADNIHIKLPDGSDKEFPKGTTALDVAKSISPRLADAAIAAKTNGNLIDLTRPLEKDTDLRILTDKDPEAWEFTGIRRRICWRRRCLNFFRDQARPRSGDRERILLRLLSSNSVHARGSGKNRKENAGAGAAEPALCARISAARSKAWSSFKNEGDFMKCHFIEQFTKPDEKISIYKTGKFLDFCRGPHIPSTGKIKAFKLLNIAGAYWLGDEKNPQLQRIYGTSFFSKKDLDAYLHQIEEAKKRDHRVLGKQLDLFSIQELAGPGLIFWHPKGGIIRKEMEDWMRDQYLKRGYSLVYTPHVMRKQLWQTSGHEGYYSQNMFDVMELDDAEYRLKPMNCPGHILIYKDSLKSYRDLPVRLGELGTVYRYERSGVMHGLLRVRGFTQDDAHIFCTPEQIEKEIADCVEFARDVLHDFGFDKFVTELSTWDPDDTKEFRGIRRAVELGDCVFRESSEVAGIEYTTIPGEAAFYGPKIDIKLVDAIGRLWQLSTVQFDFNLPARFGSGIRCRRRHAQAAGDGASRAVWIDGALLRRADRALRGSISGMAVAGAGGAGPDCRAPRGVCE